MSKKVIIIGAGLAGLSSGIYLQKSGVETEIFELAPWAGGMCTSWVRSGYRFDGCIHWMVGTKSGDNYNKLYKEVGALEEDTVIYNADSIQMEIKGVMYEIPMKLFEFESFLHELSSQDEKSIKELCSDIEIMLKTKMPSGMPSNLSELIGIMRHSGGFLKLARKYLKLTVKDVADKFQNETIKTLLYYLMAPEMSAIALVMMLGTRMSGNAGYPMGGSLELIKRMEAKYKSLGGKIHYNSKVDEILVKDGMAVGIRAKGSLYPSNAVIAACDAHAALFDMLGGKYKHRELDNMLESAPLFPTLTMLSYGLDKQFKIPYSILYECAEGIETAPGFRQHYLSLRSFEFDKASAPQNGSSVMVTFASSLDYWEKLRSSNIEEYKKEKQKLADAVADQIDKRIPGFKDAITVCDVATPATYVRLTNVYKGSFEGFLPIPSLLKKSIKKTIPGLKNFCICGQWTTVGGGICSAIADGKYASKLIAKEL